MNIHRLKLERKYHDAKESLLGRCKMKLTSLGWFLITVIKVVWPAFARVWKAIIIWIGSYAHSVWLKKLYMLTAETKWNSFPEPSSVPVFLHYMDVNLVPRLSLPPPCGGWKERDPGNEAEQMFAGIKRMLMLTELLTYLIRFSFFIPPLT